MENDLSSLFDLEFAPDAAITTIQDTGATQAYRETLCVKCNGRGKFVGYTGRVIGDCFACNGTGLSHSAGRETPEGGCTKCFGTGQWRPGRSCFACNGTGQAAMSTTAQVDVSKIAAAFATAHSNGIETPRLRLGSFVFSRAKDTSANPGAIYVKERTEYLGKIARGEFLPSRACTPETTERIAAVCVDPDASARAYGMETKRCSCCGLKLTNKLSRELGIGPICREKYGWGG